MRTDSSMAEDRFDLLPFISILMCLLGTLLLITMSLATMYLKNPGAVWMTEARTTEHVHVPVLLEWDGGTVSIHDESGITRIPLGSETQRWWRSDGSFVDARMNAFLDSMAARKGSEYVLFAVRPSGFDNFQTLASEFRTRKIAVGYEPIEQHKSVRLRSEAAHRP